MKITIEITSETTDHDLNRIANAVNSLTEKPNEDAENQKNETKKAQKAERVSEKPTDVEVSQKPEPTSKTAQDQTLPPSVDSVEDSADKATDRATETPQVDYDSLKKKVLDAKANGLDFEGAIERGTNGLSRKLIPIKSETHLFGAIYSELEKLFRDAKGA